MDRLTAWLVSTGDDGRVSRRVWFGAVLAATMTLSACTGVVTGKMGAAEVPPAPSGAKASALSAADILLTWIDNSSNEIGFTVERASSSSGPFVAIGTADANTTSYDDGGLSPSTTYYYRLRAVNGAGHSAYSSVASATTRSAPPPPTDVAAALAVLAQRAIFFDHASVGTNILSGVQALLDANSGSEPTLVSTTSPGSIHTGVWAGYGWFDLNTHPSNKVAQFQSHMNGGGIGAKVDLAFMKLCFIDFDSGGDSVKTEEEATALFTAYQSMVAAVEASNPDVKLIHFTAPLVAAGNARREAYNGRIRNAYSSTGRVFDLADIESNGHTDSDGRVLDPDYNTGDGHLNSAGQAVVARALVLFLASLP